MARERFDSFLRVTVELIKMWLDEAFLPLVTAPEKKKEELPKETDPKHPSDKGHPSSTAMMAPFLEEGWISIDFEEEDNLDSDEHRIIFVSMPWGQTIPIPFSPEDWAMIREISKDSGETVLEVLKDVIKERYDMAMYMEDNMPMPSIDLFDPPDQDDTDSDE